MDSVFAVSSTRKNAFSSSMNNAGFSFEVDLVTAMRRPAPLSAVSVAVQCWQRKISLPGNRNTLRSEEHTSELQSLMRISYDVFCLKKKKKNIINKQTIRRKAT